MMRFRSGIARVDVPASSANLGPGFDSLGLALSMYDRLEAQVTDGGLDIEVVGEGAGEVPRDESNLVAVAMRTAFAALGEQPPGLALRCRNVIPHGRGLGSSAAAIVGGIVLARRLAGDGGGVLEDTAALRLASRLEGHADNVAAALLGGLVIAWCDEEGDRAVRLGVDAHPVAYVPPYAVPTQVARELLPEQVRHGDAVRNAGRVALLVAAFTGRPDLLFPATEDCLHQPFRAGAMPESYDLLQRLRHDGVPAVVSGAGPTVLAFAADASGRSDLLARGPDGWGAFALDVDLHGASGSSAG